MEAGSCPCLLCVSEIAMLVDHKSRLTAFKFLVACIAQFEFLSNVIAESSFF